MDALPDLGGLLRPLLSPIIRLGQRDKERRLFRASDFHDIVSGRRRGVGAMLLRGVFRCVEGVYGTAVQRRNRRFDRNPTAVRRVAVPVLSVGNLTLGGTGKTPLVRWITRWFTERGVRAAIVSRGYGAKAGQSNDEALELQRLLPGVLHLQNPDRVAAARRAVEESRSQVIVLDDAFQHRRIGRDLDIVLLDALAPFGYGHLFPRGTLREPVAGLGRADIVVLTRADHLDAAARTALWQAVRVHAPRAATAETIHAPQRLILAGGESMPLGALRGRSVAAFCGIGNPVGFRHTLDVCGCRVVAFREFADHHRYVPADLDALASWAQRSGASAVVCTGKDLVKLDADRLADLPLWGVEIELEFLSGRESLEERLQQLLPQSY